MKKITIASQRKLYEMYKEARLSELNVTNSLYNTGSYSRPGYSEMEDKAKIDILNFSFVFEEELKREIKKDLDKIFN
ncbi:hypothetical protein QU593_10230 [Rossellomorea marisflavi]|uniref:hypothetical protein n=1 Tax=Rossellomorea marisflavi TaxID=189381 RepID=UPI0025AEF705|nr:hypothetical protein [Rossellomorea marisflavi]WJV20782.1 hypothetical protein QU593_10230 [Rossellomorea marisflavi]